MNKREELNKLKSQINLSIKGLENYPKNELNVLVSNHNCLMDIFYVPMSLPEEIVSLISARLTYKEESNRKSIIERYLYAMPIEAHGGRAYANMGLNYATKMLENGISVNIFPEGAYVEDKKIFRGRTGASRLIYNIRDIGKQVNLVPVSISVLRNDDLDSFDKIGDNVEITFLPPINYEDSYYGYKYAESNEEKNGLLHIPIDTSMKLIADSLGLPYVDSYIELRPKGNVMFADGSVIETGMAQNPEFIDRYNRELEDRVMQLTRKLTRGGRFKHIPKMLGYVKNAL